jgi:flagellar biogenesis protein FliO
VNSLVLAASTVELTLRMLVALGVVAVLLTILSRTVRRRLGVRGGPRPWVVIRHQQRLDKHSAITLLQAGDRNLLVGTSGQSIVLLAEGEDLVAAPTDEPAGRSGARRTTTSTAGDRPTIDVRTRALANPIKILQNKTVRRG